VCTALILYGLSFVLSIRIYEDSKLHIVTPVFMGLVFVIVAILSFVLFKEPVTSRNLFGIILVLAGIYMIVI
jgi:multidrug transporter EmrE-like cation transporter